MSAPLQADWPDLLEEAVASVAGLVGAASATTDWSAQVPGLDWSHRAVLEHMADNFVWYASLLVRGRTDGFPAFAVRLEGELDPAGLADSLTSLAGVLGAAVRAADPDDRGWHPCGTAGPRDYAAMGVLEVLVHGEDLSRAFGATWAPPPAPVQGVLALLFGGHDPGSDPWRRLLELCGRTGGSDDWRWFNTGT